MRPSPMGPGPRRLSPMRPTPGAHTGRPAAASIERRASSHQSAAELVRVQIARSFTTFGYLLDQAAADRLVVHHQAAGAAGVEHGLQAGAVGLDHLTALVVAADAGQANAVLGVLDH